jgi:hypothetical protein
VLQPDGSLDCNLGAAGRSCPSATAASRHWAETPQATFSLSRPGRVQPGSNQGDLSVVEETYTEDLICRGGRLGEVRGRLTYTQMLAASVGGAFTGMRLDVQQIIADGDNVAVLFTNGGTGQGELLGIPGTGKTPGGSVPGSTASATARSPKPPSSRTFSAGSSNSASSRCPPGAGYQ